MQLTLGDLKQIMMVTHTGMTVDEFHAIVKIWLASSVDPRFHHPQTETVYQPMLEAIQYLQANNFQVYIVTGSQKFVRSFAKDVYNIGTMGATQYKYVNNKPVLIKRPNLLHFDDAQEKPEAINFFIGQKPLIAFGNPDGDKRMLLIHHDDAVREYAYGPNAKIGTFSDALMRQAIPNNWVIVSMKNDWRVLFPFELNNKKAD